MNRTFIVTALVGALGVFGGCNNVGDCPAASSITPGGSCSGNNLQCPYTLPASSGDDGGGTATSCVCTDGTWVCPSAGDDGGSDAAEDSESDSTVESGPDAVPGDAMPDVGPEATIEASAEASAEAAPEAAPDVASEGAGEASSDAAGQ